MNTDRQESGVVGMPHGFLEESYRMDESGEEGHLETEGQHRTGPEGELAPGLLAWVGVGQLMRRP